MRNAVLVEIDNEGLIHPVSPEQKLPPGRAVLTWPSEDVSGLLLSEQALAVDWLTPEEDAAWEYLQPGK